MAYNHPPIGRKNTTYIPLIYCLLGGYMLPTTLYRNLKNPLIQLVPSLNLTASLPLKIHGWKMNFLLDGLVSGFMLVLGKAHSQFFSTSSTSGTLKGSNTSHLGKRKIIFKSTFGRGYVSSQEGKF